VQANCDLCKEGNHQKQKAKGKRNHAPQTDLIFCFLLVKMLISQDSLIFSKYADNGVSYPKIRIVEIQKTVVETCRVAPLEVIMELLLASRPEDEASPSKSGVTNDHDS
jgi:hypothetical protein